MTHQYNLTYIFSDEQLSSACETLSKVELIGVDTEFERRNTYHAILCLIQLCAGDDVYIVDPFEINDFTPLLALFADQDIIKVVHACAEDIEVLSNAIGAKLNNMVDTQVGLGLLGENASVGYQAMVDKLCEKHVEKEVNHLDWKKRPLSDAQLNYAAQDVIYLAPCFNKLHDRLKSIDREQWWFEQGEWQASAKRHTTDPALAYLRYKLAWKLKPRELCVLQKVAEWVEQQAVNANVPRNFILHSQLVFHAAENLPQNLNDLKTKTKIPNSFIKRFGKKLVSLIEQGLEMSNDLDRDAFFAIQKKRDRLFKALKKAVNRHCDELKTPSAHFASRKTTQELTEKLLDNHADVEAIQAILGKWQYRLLKTDIDELVNTIVQPPQ